MKILNALWTACIVTLIFAAYTIGIALLCVHFSWWFSSLWVLVPLFAGVAIFTYENDDN